MSQLKRKLVSNPNVHRRYAEGMTDLIDKGHAELVRDDEAIQGNRIWFLPHHGGHTSKQAREAEDCVRLCKICWDEFERERDAGT